MISQTSEYALRAALYLAGRSDSAPAAAQEISGAIQVPVGYLQKILRMLARDGILTAQRGTRGGFSLAKVPTAISVLDVLKASDGQIQRIERCPLGIRGHVKLCSLHRLLDQQAAAAERAFAATSLAELLESSGDVRPLCESGSTLPVPVSVERLETDSSNRKKLSE